MVDFFSLFGSDVLYGGSQCFQDFDFVHRGHFFFLMSQPCGTLWVTFQLQSANVHTAHDMWFGLFLAVTLAFFTSFGFAQVSTGRYQEDKEGQMYPSQSLSLLFSFVYSTLRCSIRAAALGDLGQCCAQEERRIDLSAFSSFSFLYLLLFSLRLSSQKPVLEEATTMPPIPFLDILVLSLSSSFF